MQQDADKCKEMIIDFKRNNHVFNHVNGKELSVVESVKILGLTVSSNLLWNNHVIEAIKKSNKRIFFLVLLKRAGVPLEDIIIFYCTTIRPVLEYCPPVFHHALPQYLSDDIERVQKRALSIISPGQRYEATLNRFSLTTLKSRRLELCKKLFNTISSPSHELSSLLPPSHQTEYNLRQCRLYNLPRICTERFKRSFIP